MRIQVLREKTKEVRDFGKREWKIADKEHFDNPGEWKEEKYYLVAFDKEGNINGTLGMEIEAGTAHVKTLIVSKDKRRSGIGRELMLKAEEVSRKNNAHKIYLQTGKDWQAVNFYKSLGYKITAEIPMHHFKKDYVMFSKFL